MNSIETWTTKEQLLKDMSKLTGRRVRNIDESYVLVGNAPPPVMQEPEDEEMLAQFGDAVDRSFHGENAPPDLQGITDMLRIVQHNDEENDEDFNEPSNCVIAISKASKLNPNVCEFVPKCTSTSPSNVDLSDNNKTDVKQETNCDLVDKVNPSVDDLATKLKNKISVASKSDSFEDQKQKNVAIASLLRLYATSNSQKKTKEPVKLITPDFYETTSRNDDVVTEQTPTKELGNVQSTSLTPDHQSDPGIIRSTTPSCSLTEVKSEPTLNTPKDKPSSSKPKLDPHVKQSIDKVNQWLGEPVKKKAPGIYLGPVTFKRKEPNAKSPVPQPEETKPKQVKSNGQYQPSGYADDLYKKLMERSKAKQKNRNMWTNLHDILKEKDEELTRKRLQQASYDNAS